MSTAAVGASIFVMMLEVGFAPAPPAFLGFVGAFLIWSGGLAFGWSFPPY